MNLEKVCGEIHSTNLRIREAVEASLDFFAYLYCNLGSLEPAEAESALAFMIGELFVHFCFQVVLENFL